MRGILFDKDGTLLDFEATWTPVLRRLALDAADGDWLAAEKLLDAGGLDPATGRFRTGSAIGAGTTRTIVALWHPRLAGADLAAQVTAMDRAFLEHGGKRSVVIKSAPATLDLLKGQGYAMGVATNDTTAAARAALAATGMLGHLPHVFGYDAVVHAKPAPDMVFAFADAVAIPVTEIVVVGDNPHDLEMGRSAGAGLVVGVTSGNSTAADLTPLADAVLPSVRELPAYLDQNRK